MTRCFKTSKSPHVSHWMAAVGAAVLLIAGSAPIVAVAQNAPPAQLQHSQARTFPPSSLRGKLVVKTPAAAEINSKVYNLAPGLRIFNQQNQLMFAHTLIDQPIDVRYVIEPSTGYLHTVWQLTQAEVDLEPKPPSLLKSWFGWE